MYSLRVYYGNKLKEFDVDEKSKNFFGNFKKCNLHIDEVPKLRASGNRVIINDNGYISGRKKLAFNDYNVIDYLNRIGVIVYKKDRNNVLNIDLSAVDKVNIGSDDDNDIVIKCEYMNGKHLILEREADIWKFTDNNTINKTYQNGEMKSQGILANNDIISIGLAEIKYENQVLSIIFDGEISNNIKNEKIIRTIDSIEEPYPYYFRQSPRLRADVPSEKFEIQPAPNIGEKPKVSLLSVVVPPLLSVGIMFAVSYFVMGTMTTLLFSAPMAIIGVFMSIGRYRDEKAKYKEKEELRYKKYDDYINSEVDKIENLAKSQRSILLNDNPSTLQCIHLVDGPKRTLYDRRWTDNDFMYIRLGSGTVPSNFTIGAPQENKLALEVDELHDTPNNIAKKYENIENCPVVMNFGDHAVCGLIGDRDRCISLSKNILVQTTAHHSYDDLRVVLICDERETDEFAFARFMPHIYDNDKSKRYFANTKETADNILDEINEELNKRLKVEDQFDDNNEEKRPFYLFVFASIDLTSQHPIIRKVPYASKKYGFGFIFLWDNLYNLPKDCYYVCELKNRFIVFEKDRAQLKTEFNLDYVKNSDYEYYARGLAPIRIDIAKKSTGLPRVITFLQGFNVNKPSELNIKENWENVAPEKSMAVPIGVLENGKDFLFDINEKAYGPHGLVAGMTGSGKSEMVQSWILSMCVKFPPTAVNFVLIDFKGTGLILPFKNLPHLAGTISDLDTSIGRNLIALENELNRRKSLLNKYGVNNISNYLKLVREGKAKEDLPYLFVVIDEFAEFKLKFPEFMQAVNSIFAIGRTLGVHIILLTQKPSSVIDDKMNANTRFRWCLKVANSQDSRDMLHHADAAKITNPGRAYVQVGEDEVYVEVQSYWSGALYNPYNDSDDDLNKAVSVVDIYGNKKSFEKRTDNKIKSEKSEIEAVVDYLNQFALNNDYNKALQIWTNKLPDVLSLNSLVKSGFDGKDWSDFDYDIKPIIGLVDDPITQSQFNLQLDFRQNGNVAIYGAPGTGKTTLLYTLITSLVKEYTPDNVSIYGLDFGGGGLALFNNFPHVGGIAVSGDDDKISKLSTMLLDELDNRKKMIAKVGLTSIDALRKTTDEVLPNIVLVIDNFQAILEQYPDLDQFLQTYSRDGSSVGMYMVATSSSITGITYRVTNSIKYNIALNLNEKSDYINVIGQLQGMTIDNLPGRGLIKGTPPREIQIALPIDSVDEMERVTKIRELADAMKTAWKGKSARPIPVMPARVLVSEYDTKDIFVGLNQFDIREEVINLRERQFMIISSSNDVDLLNDLIFSQIINKIKVDKIVAYGESTGIKEYASIDIKDFDDKIKDLLPELQNRKKAYKGTKLDESEYPYIVIYIENYKKCFDAMAQETSNYLGNIVNLAKDLNVIVVVSDTPTNIQSLSADLFMQKMISNELALLYGGTLQKHTAFSLDIPYSEQTKTMPKDAAYLKNDTEVSFIKIVQGL